MYVLTVDMVIYFRILCVPRFRYCRHSRDHLGLIDIIVLILSVLLLDPLTLLFAVTIFVVTSYYNLLMQYCLLS